MPRPQFTLRALLVAMLVVGAFFGGAEFGRRRERQRMASELKQIEFAARKVQQWEREALEPREAEWPR